MVYHMRERSIVSKLKPFMDVGKPRSVWKVIRRPYNLDLDRHLHSRL